MLHARGIILQPHPNSVRLLHHVPVGDDVALGIDDYPRTQRPLANRAIAAQSTRTSRPAKEVVEEIIHPTAATIFIVVRTLLLPPALPSRILDRRLGIDVDHTRPQLLG